MPPCRLQLSSRGSCFSMGKTYLLVSLVTKFASIYVLSMSTTPTLAGRTWPRPGAGPGAPTGSTCGRCACAGRHLRTPPRDGRSGMGIKVLFLLVFLVEFSYNVPQAGEVLLGGVGARSPAVQIEHFHFQTLNFGAGNGVAKVLQKFVLIIKHQIRLFLMSVLTCLMVTSSEKLSRIATVTR